ncbi:MAG: efflux RND transporter periplasmic adaptor subunit [Sphingobium sp.]
MTDDGVTRAQELYTVSAPVTGYVRRLETNVGDQVAKGDLVAQMTGRPSAPLDRRSRAVLQDTLDAARAQLRGAEASLSQARRDLQRSESLAKAGFVARAQLDALRTRVLTGEAALQQSRAEAARIEALLAAPGAPAIDRPVEVRTPANGSVLSVLTESEGVIAEGTPLMTIGDPGKIEIVVDLLSRDAVRVRQGDRVAINQWGGSGTLAARVTRVEPFGRLKVSALGIEEQRVNIIIRLEPSASVAASRLGHGYQVEATVILWSRDDALRVPIGALVRGRSGGWTAFAVREGRAREIPVRIGQVNDTYGEVIAGLDEGEQIIVNPGTQVTAGVRIRSR